MNVACLKCGTKIAMQSPSGAPTCIECGEISKHDWDELCINAEIKDMRNNETSNKKVFGIMEISVNTEFVSAISCYHCKEKITIMEDVIEEKNCDCPSCNQKLEFESIKSHKDFAFYRYVNQKIDPSHQKSVIAVHCAACGAPMQKDPGKVNYNCNFCGVENILPISLRQKRVLDDVFVGVQKKIPSPKKILEFNNQQLIVECLKGNKLEAFDTGTLNALMQKFPDNLQIYHLIANDLRHTFPNETYEKLWETSKSSPFLSIIAQKLNKSENEKKMKLKKGDTNKKPIAKNSKQEEKGLFGKILNWFTSPRS
ncbi:MAG: hypothetical protein JNJ41_19810 [Bacteroidia bacterium]|nr:hypothetical protein [Bacteroidia bacterium]